MNYKGRIVFIGQPKQVTDKFTLREFVLTNPDETYPQEVKFQVSNKNCSLLDRFNVGDIVDVAFNLRGKRYQGKDGQPGWFTTVEAWKITGQQATPEKDYNDAFNNNEVPF